MKLNSPLPQTLPKECTKAASICMISFHTIIFVSHLPIVRSFVDNGNNGLDGVIPRYVLENAKGFAIFTIFKAGFIFSARAGSGIVIAKLDNGCMSFEFSSQNFSSTPFSAWSAPSAIGTAGLGVGGQAGAEMTDFLVVLNSRSVSRLLSSPLSVLFADCAFQGHCQSQSSHIDMNLK